MKGLLIICLFYLSCTNKNDKKISQPPVPVPLVLDSIYQALQPGDIIFRAGTDIESEVIRKFSRKDKTFSHCGLVVPGKDSLKVFHILGGEDNMEGSILYESIQEFIHYPHNSSIGIYNLKLQPNELVKAINYIDSLKKQKTTFDLSFNLFNKDKRYCTELIIDALEFCSKRFRFKPALFEVYHTKWQFLANKGHQFLFYPIDDFQHYRLMQWRKTFEIPLN